MTGRDPRLDTLLLLDGKSFVADADGKYWVKFVVKQVEASPERPHGLNYSLTLHDEDGARLIGFENAHAVREGSGPGAQTRIEYDHKHSGKEFGFTTTWMLSRFSRTSGQKSELSYRKE